MTDGLYSIQLSNAGLMSQHDLIGWWFKKESDIQAFFFLLLFFAKKIDPKNKISTAGSVIATDAAIADRFTPQGKP